MREFECEYGTMGQSCSETNLPDCPLCCTRMVIEKIIPGRLGLEHWTLRCTNCGHIHQDAFDRASHPIQLRA
jgi:uncharacterized Zn finger protein